MNIVKKWAAGLLSAALVLSLAGCNFSTPATVMTVGGTDIPAGLYLFYQYQAYKEAQTKLTGTNTTVKNGEIDGKSATTWVHDKTVEYARRYAWVQKSFDEQKLTITDEEKSSAQTQAQSSYESNKALLAANGIGEKSYLNYYMGEIKYQKLYSAYAQKNAATISDADAKAYMDANYAHIRTLTLPTTDASYASLSEDNVAKINGFAADLVKELSAGGDFAALAPEVLQKAFEVCGREYKDDSLSTYYSESFASEDSTSYPADFVQKVMSAKVGDADIYTAYSAPMVYQKVPNYSDDGVSASTFDTYRSAILSQMTLKDFDASLASGAAALELSENAAAVKTYAVSKIKTSV